jgi:diguanylate cyclase (GGDEF)-like protein/PAS domain S-box-containing protein
MLDKDKSKEKLLQELSEMRLRIIRADALHSEYMKTKDALKKSEEKFRKLVETANDAIFIADAETGIIIDANQRAETLLGIPVEKIIGMHQTQLHPPEEAERYGEIFQRHIETGKATTELLFVVNGSGQKIPVEISANVTEIAGKKIIQGIFRDVSERIASDKALKESEQLFHTLFHQAADSIFLMNPLAKGGPVILNVNKFACDMHGYTQKELIGKPISMLDDSETGEHIPERTRRLMAGEILTFEGTHIRKDGSTFPVEISAQMIKINDKPYILAIDRNIADRKNIEKALIIANTEWEQTFDTIPDIIIVIDNQHRIVKANRALAEKLGLKREDLVGKVCYNVIHGTDEPPHYCPHIKTSSDGKQHITEIFESTLQGHFLVSATPIFDNKGRAQGIVEVAHDITEYKKIEEKLHTTSITDELTGLLNRRGFFTIAAKQCEIACRKNFDLYFLFMDLDGLKVINDKHGHKVGDMALVDTANIIKESYRASDILARIGGDEFVVMTMETPEVSAEMLTKRLKNNISEYNQKEDKPYDLSLSFGLACYDHDHPCSIDELISKADKMMYEEKKSRQRL